MFGRAIITLDIGPHSSFGSIHHLQPRRHHGHLRKIRQKTQFCARMCLLGVAKLKFNTYTPFSPKTAILGPDLDGT